MARRCACDRLLDTLRNDPRLRVLPAAARYLWIALADALMRLPEPGVFILGSRVGSISDICLMLSMPKPEVETCLVILLETQMVTQRDDGVLVLPDAMIVLRPASTSAQNGRKSLGRPRKGETVDQYKMRLVSVIPGGLAASAETQDETQPHGRAGLAAAASLSSQEESKQQPHATVAALGAQVVEIAQMDEIRGVFNFQPVTTWLAAGATPELIVEIVSAMAARANYRAPRTLGYFTDAIREATGQAASAAPATLPRNSSGRTAALAAFDRDVQAYQASGCYGPVPVLRQEMAA